MSQISRAAPSLARPRGLSPFLPAIPAVLLHPWRGIRAAVSSLPLASVPAGVANRKPRSGRRGMARLELRLGGEPPFAVGAALLTPHNSAKPLDAIDTRVLDAALHQAGDPVVSNPSLGGYRRPASALGFKPVFEPF